MWLFNGLLGLMVANLNRGNLGRRYNVKNKLLQPALLRQDILRFLGASCEKYDLLD
ncbi:MAG: hypothetical protein HC890_11075 [Chloroflexaceae bacterium]|nr:hypothetical protein [Chloroflexaceae bacterium]